ncbi:MAG: P-loop NTPase, partial [Hyphomonadaceae bacterium]|nr:P-loop NTPase [Hyphomonadaceae bacterium]
TMPQAVSVSDARRGAEAFQQLQVPILGVIENMAYFETPDGKRTHIFGEGGARRVAAEAGAPFLGEIPIDIALRESCDAGAPLVATQPEHPVSKRFRGIATTAQANVARMNKPAPTIRVK